MTSDRTCVHLINKPCGDTWPGATTGGCSHYLKRKTTGMGSDLRLLRLLNLARFKTVKIPLGINTCNCYTIES